MLWHFVGLCILNVVMPDTISHKKNFKNTTIIGGAQFAQIVAGIIRAKFIAVLLGTVGIGINGIMVSAINIITQIAGLGLNFSAVREISKNGEQNTVELSRTIIVVRRWLYASAIAGAMITVFLSYFLSLWSFENDLYVWSFIILSIAVAFNVLNNGNLSILQGLQKIKLIALASLIGVIAGLFTSIPLYYFWGVNAIPYAIVVAAVTSWLVSSLLLRKLKIPKADVSLTETLVQGKEMASLGIVMMISQVIGLVVIYIINAYISNKDSLSVLGLYQAGVGITTQYSAIIFTAMATEYFPRLSSVYTDRKVANATINQQIEISLLIITPIVLLVMMTAPVTIRILLSSEFDVIRRFIELMAMSIILKGASFPIGYLSFARGDKRTFFLLEGIAGSSIILLSGIGGFYLGGLNGIAYCTIITNFLYLFIIIGITRKLYGYQMNKAAGMTTFLSISVSLVIIALLYNYNVWTISVSALIVGGVLLYYLRKINKIIDISHFIKSRILNR